jgi:hypothetical protein
MHEERMLGNPPLHHGHVGHQHHGSGRCELPLLSHAIRVIGRQLLQRRTAVRFGTRLRAVCR